MSRAIVWSRNVTPDSKAAIQSLLASGQWSLTPTQDGIQRTYVFKGFSSAMRFWDEVIEKCKQEKHHPEWANVYNKVSVRWTTHKPRGLGVKDAVMASFCDKAASNIGFESPGPKEADDGALNDLLLPRENCGVCVKPDGEDTL